LGLPFQVAPFRPEVRSELQQFYENFEPKRAAHGLPPGSPAGIVKWLNTILPTGIHLLAWRDGLIGHGFIVPTEKAGVGEYAVFLARDLRGKGVGTELNRAVVEAARRAGVKRLWLTVEPRNRAAVRSYEKAGFEFIPRTLYSTEPEMELKLEG
jgi:RimJ/RimL family protein N-acetyltransferase